MKVIVFGATGMVGEGVLHEALLHDAVDAVLAIGRRSCGVTHPKLMELLHDDFFNFIKPTKGQKNAFAASRAGGLFYPLLKALVPVYITRDILYFAAITGAIVVYVSYFRQHARLHFAYSAFVFAGIYSVLYLVAAELQFAFVLSAGIDESNQTMLSAASAPTFYGVTIGFAVGAGITLAETLLGRAKGAPRSPAENNP